MFEPQSDESLDWEDHLTSPGLTSARHVLVVEDDPALRHLIAKVLAAEGYFVTEADDGRTMLDILAQSQSNRYCAFDLIVTDVNMPRLTGLDALACLRRSGCRTPAIVVSALPVELVQNEAEQLQAVFLPKPFASENLRRIANRAVSCHRGDSRDNR